MLNIPRRYTLTKRMEESSENNTKNNSDSITATTSTKVTTGNEIKEMHFPWKSTADCNFVHKLHRLLDYAHENGYENIVSWTPDGSCFGVCNSEAFMKHLCPKFFPKQTFFRSFERMLNIWGFVRPITVSNDRNMPAGSKSTAWKLFHHPFFVKDKPQLCRRITRQPAKGTSQRRGPMVITRKNLTDAERRLQSQALDFLSNRTSNSSSSIGKHSSRERAAVPPTTVAYGKPASSRERELCYPGTADFKRTLPCYSMLPSPSQPKKHPSGDLRVHDFNKTSTSDHVVQSWLETGTLASPLTPTMYAHQQPYTTTKASLGNRSGLCESSLSTKEDHSDDHGDLPCMGHGRRICGSNAVSQQHTRVGVEESSKPKVPFVPYGMDHSATISRDSDFTGVEGQFEDSESVQDKKVGKVS